MGMMQRQKRIAKEMTGRARMRVWPRSVDRLGRAIAPFVEELRVETGAAFKIASENLRDLNERLSERQK